ncbi:MAG: LuxR C-terminal-related transcriptional regulator [Pseudonocardia sp.]
MAHADAGRAARTVSRLTHREPDLDRLRTDLDRALRALVGWDAAAWATTDPATLLFTSCVLCGRAEDTGLESRLFALEFARDDVNTFAELTRLPVPVGTLRAATGGQPERSRRYRELLRPLGVTDELRAAFVENGQCWGTLIAYRTGGAPFGPDEVAVLAAIGPAVAAGLRTAMLHAALQGPPGPGPVPGVVLIAADGAVRDISPQARHWLDEADVAGQVPSVLRSVAAATRAAAGEHGPAVPAAAHARLPGRSGGWIRLHGTLLEASGEVAVVVEPATEVHLADVLVRAYGLTPREREVTELVARGYSTADIAGALFISAYTVQDHLKSILAKTGVPNRRELVAALHGRHYAPVTRTGGRPGPYGWYLADPAEP